jgi:hypothetical protein
LLDFACLQSGKESLNPEGETLKNRRGGLRVDRLF